jgi:hypothetical protein
MSATIRPSSLPMLDACPRFERGEVEDFTELGTQRHEALTQILTGDGDALNLALEEDDSDGVQWAADYIQLHAPMADHELRVKLRVNPIADDFTPIFPNGGEADAACGPHLFDFKWRERNYDAQMAAYALALFEEGHTIVTVHVMFGATRRAQVYKLNEDSARTLVMGIIARASDPASAPSPCDYCGWCAKRLTCKPFIRTARRVAEGYADEPLLSQVKSWHPSEVQSAEEMALMLTIARKLLKPWYESVEHHAHQMVTKQGQQLPGYELKEKRGRKFVSDVAAAHEILQLPAADLLRCCDLRLNTSKTNKDKAGVIDVYAAVKQLKRSPAAREVANKLGDVIQTGKPTLSLVAVGEKETEE